MRVSASDFNRSGLTFVISLALFFLLIGCASQPQPGSNSNIKKPVPSWVYEPNVGVARQSASGSFNAQRMLAIQRAIAEMLISSGQASGESVVSLSESLKISEGKESYNDDYDQKATIRTTFKDKTYEVEQINSWLDPYTKKYYVQIKER